MYLQQGVVGGFGNQAVVCWSCSRRRKTPNEDLPFWMIKNNQKCLRSDPFLPWVAWFILLRQYVSLEYIPSLKVIAMGIRALITCYSYFGPWRGTHGINFFACVGDVVREKSKVLFSSCWPVWQEAGWPSSQSLSANLHPHFYASGKRWILIWWSLKSSLEW